MAQNLVTKYKDLIDERFKTGPITGAAINRDYTFEGAKTIKIFSVPTKEMTDYQRNGANRYGIPSELDNEEQEVSIRRDRAFTFTVDKANEDESGGSLNAGAALRRQQDEVIIPEIDQYRLGTMAAHAGKIEYGDYTGDTGAYKRVLQAIKHLNGKSVPRDGRVCYVTGDFLIELQMDKHFVEAAKINPETLIRGQDGSISKAPVVSVPDGYLPSGVEMMMVHPVATTAAEKLAEYRVHSNPPGINGDLCEGRVYYDAFVRNNKRDAIYVLRTGLGALTATSAAGSGVGKTAVTVSGHQLTPYDAVGTLVYKTGTSVTAPTLGADLSGWTVLNLIDGAAELTATNGHKLCVAAKDAQGKCVAASAVVDVVSGT